MKCITLVAAAAFAGITGTSCDKRGSIRREGSHLGKITTNAAPPRSGPADTSRHVMNKQVADAMPSRQQMDVLLRGSGYTESDLQQLKSAIESEAAAANASPMSVAAELVVAGETQEGQITRLGYMQNCYPATKQQLELYCSLSAGSLRTALATSFVSKMQGEGNLSAINDFYLGLPLGFDRKVVACSGADLSFVTGGAPSFLDYIEKLEMPEEQYEALMNRAKLLRDSDLSTDQRVQLSRIIDALGKNQQELPRIVFNLK